MHDERATRVRPKPRRLGVYSDGPFSVVDTADGKRIAPDVADHPFLTFVCAVGSEFDATLLFSRVGPTRAADERVMLPRWVSLQALPYYDSLLRIDQLVRATPGTLRGFWRGLSEVDAVWVFGPHPFAFPLVAAAMLRRRRVVLGVRQDTVAYYRGRLPSSRWKPALVVVHLWDIGFRLLARFLRTTVVGTELSRPSADEGARLLPMTVSLVRDADVVDEPPMRDWSGTTELLTVGRIDPEKNPLLLVEALAALRERRPGTYRLVWVGTGALEGAVRTRAEELGVSDLIELVGFVPFGPELLERYRRAHVFVHVSLTEGVPAVLIEALANGTPIVATDVGGVAASLDGGGLGVLVPPRDAHALVAGILETLDDPAERERRIARGLEFARERTLDRQAARVAQFIKDPAIQKSVD